MPIPFEFDFRKPDYTKVWRWRVSVLNMLRNEPESLDAFKTYYRSNPAAFINHWGSTYDPRNADIGLPTVIPFILFEKQEEWINDTVEKWRNRENGVTAKSRDVGMSWLSLALACTICIFEYDISIGFGSRKEIYVDNGADPKSLLWKGRMFMDKLPREFKGSFNLKQHSPFMKILFPDSGSTITGEAGDGIGRGDRKSIYFVDESAYLERPQLIEASLSATTNCRIDISSARGMNNPFAQKVHSGKVKVFIFNWRDDPRKDPDHKIYKIEGKEGLFNWYDWMVNKIDDPVVLAQEVDMNFAASVEGVVIPAEWIVTAIDACKFLDIVPTGLVEAALDLADQGKDKNAICIRKGVEIQSIKSWSGKNGDSLITAQTAFNECDKLECESLQYDADGLGAFIRSDFRVISERRDEQNFNKIQVYPFRGSGEVLRPEREDIPKRKNKDYFANRKAQAWWNLRLRFQTTFRAVMAKKNNETFEYNPDDIISIPKTLPEYNKLIMELSQPTYSENKVGKILVDKQPDNTMSPNLADAVMMAFSPARKSGGLFS